MNDMLGMTEYLIVNDRIEAAESGGDTFYLDVVGPDGLETWEVDVDLWENLGHGDTVRHSDEEGFWLSVG